MTVNDTSIIGTLAIREQFRDRYFENHDPIADDRMLWRAHTFRHMVHLLPGQTILELGCGRGMFTRQLARVTRGENPITAVTFAADTHRQVELPAQVAFPEFFSFQVVTEDTRAPEPRDDPLSVRRGG